VTNLTKHGSGGITVLRAGLWVVAASCLAASSLELFREPSRGIPVQHLLALAAACLVIAELSAKPPRLVTEQDHELAVFRIGMWFVAGGSLAGIVTKAVWGKPRSASILQLLMLATVALLLASLLPKLGLYLLSKLRKVSLGGVELELVANFGTANEWLKNAAQELPATDVEPGEPRSAAPSPADRPFAPRRLTPPQAYQYEKLSQRLNILLGQIEDVNGLEPKARESCRRLVAYVGSAAIAMRHYSKALDILLNLRLFRDRELDHHELNLLGSAYLWAADEEPSEQRKQAHLSEGALWLSKAAELNSHDVRTAYNLGWALLSLGAYPEGIKRMQDCIALRQSVAPWALWNMACGYKKLGRGDDALQTLSQIQPGKWWEHIRADDWFAEDEPTDFTVRFRCSGTGPGPRGLAIRIHSSFTSRS
jgi:tetratricopeptide (TPR) repeat protein